MTIKGTLRLIWPRRPGNSLVWSDTGLGRDDCLCSDLWSEGALGRGDCCWVAMLDSNWGQGGARARA